MIPKNSKNHVLQDTFVVQPKAKGRHQLLNQNRPLSTEKEGTLLINELQKPLMGSTAPPNGDNKPPVKPNQKRALYRLSEIVQPHGMFPISASSWWAGVRAGIYPQSLSLGPRTTVWRAEDLEKRKPPAAAV
jgi:predicted DNA-binding transcriptional regulator AlpA